MAMFIRSINLSFRIILGALLLQGISADLPVCFNQAVNGKVVCNGVHLSTQTSPSEVKQALQDKQVTELVLKGCLLDNNLSALSQLNSTEVNSLTLDSVTGINDEITKQGYASVLGKLKSFRLTNIPALTSISNLESAGNLAQKLWESLEELIVTHCSLSSVSGKVFAATPNLVTLNISYNQIGQIDIESSTQLRGLKHFDGSHNRISNLGAITWRTFSMLFYFNLSHNLYSSSKILYDLPKTVKVMDLTNNTFHVINPPEEAVSTASDLEELRLGFNKLSTLPNLSLYKYENLRLLDLSNNPIITLNSQTLKGLNGLEVLNLSRCEISQIADEVTELPSLKTLDLSHNNLKKLPSAVFRGSRSIESLYLQENALPDLNFLVDNSAERLSNLGLLNINNNQITDLPILWRALSIQHLSMKGNSLKYLNICHRFADYPNSFPQLTSICMDSQEAAAAAVNHCQISYLSRILTNNSLTIYNRDECCEDFSSDNQACHLLNRNDQQPLYRPAGASQCPSRITDLCVTDTTTLINPIKEEPRDSFTELHSGEIVAGLAGYILLLILIVILVLIGIKSRNYNLWLRKMDWEDRNELNMSDPEMGMVHSRSGKSMESLHNTCLNSDDDSHYSAITSPSVNMAYQSSSSPFGARKKFRTKSEGSPTGSAQSDRYKPTTQLPTAAQIASAQKIATQSPHSSPLILVPTSAGDSSSPESMSVYSYARSTSDIDAIPWAAKGANQFTFHTLQTPAHSGVRSVPTSPLCLNNGSPSTVTKRKARKVHTSYKIRQTLRNPGAPSPLASRKGKMKRRPMYPIH